MGPGRERRRGRRRQRLRGRLQGRVPQPPERGRALPGRGDRGRRHPPRRLRVGARPIAILDSLRFGELDSVRSRHLLDGAVRGIGHYGNSIGVATVGGEIYFEEPYEHNCLVNAMCLGLARDQDDGPRRRRRGRQRGGADGRLDRPRRDRRRLGAGLGRARRGRRGEAPDGADRRPLRGVEGARVLPRAARKGPAGLPPGPGRGRAHLLGRGDGPAGGVGIDLDVAKVPLREADMEPFEIMVSESQERMLAVVEPARWPRCSRSARNGRRRRRRSASSPTAARCGSCAASELVGEMPVEALVDGCPLYDLEPGRAGGLDLRQPGDPRARRLRRGDAAGAARLAQRRLQALGLRAVRLGGRLAHRAPARVAPTPRSWRCPSPATRSPSRSTATGGASPATPTRGRSRRCSSAPRTSPASAPSRSA